MKSSPVFCRRFLMVGAVVMISVALVLALGVIQPVQAEVARGATPEKAVVAFWVNIGLNVVSALVLFSCAVSARGLGWTSKSTLIFVGLVVMLLGFALADAGSAYLSHGPAMHSASIILFICSAADILAGALVIGTAIMFPRKGAA